jgi:hypothetical protein
MKSRLNRRLFVEVGEPQRLVETDVHAIPEAPTAASDLDTDFKKFDRFHPATTRHHVKFAETSLSINFASLTVCTCS